MEMSCLLTAGVRPSCTTSRSLIFHAGLKAGMRLGTGGAGSCLLPLTSVTWPHMVGRYCCWLMKNGTLYTHIYEERLFFFFCNRAKSNALALLPLSEDKPEEQMFRAGLHGR